MTDEPIEPPLEVWRGHADPRIAEAFRRVFANEGFQRLIAEAFAEMRDEIRQLEIEQLEEMYNQGEEKLSQQEGEDGGEGRYDRGEGDQPLADRVGLRLAKHFPHLLGTGWLCLVLGALGSTPRHDCVCDDHQDRSNDNGDQPTNPVDARGVGDERGVDQPADDGSTDATDDREPEGEVVPSARSNPLRQHANDDANEGARDDCSNELHETLRTHTRILARGRSSAISPKEGQLFKLFLKSGVWACQRSNGSSYPPRRCRRYRGAVDVERAADLYAQGRTLRQIGAELGEATGLVCAPRQSQKSLRSDEGNPNNDYRLAPGST